MWNPLAGELLDKLTNLGVNYQDYADDIVTKARDKSKRNLCDLVQKNLVDTRD